MMKKRCLVFIFVSLVGFMAFGNAGEQEEIDFLLFLPNSGNQFVNEAQAMIQLDNVANFLMIRNLRPGQISVYGYAAAVVNGIDPIKLSRDRALYVINELQKRGLSEDLFAGPVAYGSVDLWGGKTDEGGRGLNRRVRILLDDTILTPATLQAVETWAKTPYAGSPRGVTQHRTSIKNTDSHFPWWIIPLALMGIVLIAIIIFFAARCRIDSTGEIVQGTIPLKPDETGIVISAAAPAAPKKKRIYILVKEVIRRHAYELYQQRRGQNGDAVEDWYRSVRELTSYYETLGYRVILYWEMQALTG